MLVSTALYSTRTRISADEERKEEKTLISRKAKNED